MSWVFVPGMVGLSSACESRLETPFAPSVSVSGKVVRRPLSWPGWKRRPWLQLLSGTTYDPSTLNHGAVEWISSLPVTPASRSPRQGSDSERPTLDTFGQRSLESFATFDQASCSWRTSQLTFGWDSTQCSVTWPRSGSMRSGRCWERATLEHRTAETGSGFSRGGATWPTPTAGDSKASGSRNAEGSSANPGVSLTDAIRTGDSFGRRGRSTEKPGSESRPHLNPRFVEWLMGVPRGWTTATASGCSETESCRWLRLMRSELLRVERAYSQTF